MSRSMGNGGLNFEWGERRLIGEGELFGIWKIGLRGELFESGEMMSEFAYLSSERRLGLSSLLWLVSKWYVAGKNIGIWREADRRAKPNKNRLNWSENIQRRFEGIHDYSDGRLSIKGWECDNWDRVEHFEGHNSEEEQSEAIDF
jgi:hypothetical protein